MQISDGKFYPEHISSPEYRKKVFFDRRINKVALKECACIDLTEEEYEVCCEYSSKRWSNDKKGAHWASGICNSTKDPYKAERVGLICETALAKFLDLPVDISYLEKGDKQDFLYEGYSFDIKGATRHRENGLVVKEDLEKNVKYNLKCDFYLFSYIKHEDPIRRTAEVVLVGFASKDEVRDCETAYGKIKFGNEPKHINYVVPCIQTRSIKDLLKLEQKKEICHQN